VASAKVRVKQLLGEDSVRVLPPVVFPMVVANYAARLAGEKLCRVIGDAEILSRVLFSSYQIFGYDLIMVFSDVLVEAEAMGCRVGVQEDEPPILERPAGENAHLADPQRDGRMPVVLEAARRLIQRVGEDVFVLVSLKGPFSLASFLCGPELFFEYLVEKPSAAEDFLRKATESQKRYAQAIVNIGGVPFIGDPMASGSIISPKHFARFALPYLKELVRKIHSFGVWTGLHICGDTKKFLKMMKETGANVLSIDEMDMAFVRKEIGADAVIMGNVSTRLIEQGRPADVRIAGAECLNKGLPKLILASACDVPVDAPVENVQALVKAARCWNGG